MTQDRTSGSVTVKAKLRVFVGLVDKAGRIQVQSALWGYDASLVPRVRKRRHRTVHSKATNPIVTRQVLLLVALLFSTFASAQSQPVHATMRFIPGGLCEGGRKSTTTPCTDVQRS